jgi:hypothetical protein
MTKVERFSDTLDLDRVTYKQGYGTTQIVEVPFKMTELVGGDTVIPKLVLVNSMNRESSLKLIMGVFRLICSNGMIVGDSVLNQKVRHRTGPNMNEFLENFEDNIKVAIGNLNPALEELNGLVDLKIDNHFQILRDLQEQGIITKRAFNYLSEQLALNDMRREDRIHSGNAWGLWNLANEALTRTATRRTSVASSFERNIKLVPAIRELAQAA